MIEAPWPLLDLYANPDDEDEYADLTPAAAAAEDAELAHFWSLVRAANPPPSPLPPGLQTKAFDPGKHPHGSHGRFVYTTGGKKSKHGIGAATVPAPSPPEHHLKTSKGTFTNAMTWNSKLASVQGTFKDHSRAELEHAYAHHDQRLKTWQTGGSEDPVKDAAALHELRTEAERRGMHFDTAGHLADARVPEIVVPKHQVLASTGVEHDKAHPGIYQIGRHDAQGMYADHSDQSLEAHYRAVDALLGKDHAEGSPAQAYHAAHLHEMHLEAQRRGMHFDEQGNLIGKKTTGMPETPKAEPKAGGIPEATHTVPSAVTGEADYHEWLGIYRDGMKSEDTTKLETRLAGALHNIAVHGDEAVAAHARVQAIHEIAAERGMYVGTDGKLHEKRKAASGGGVPEISQHIPKAVQEHPEWQHEVDIARQSLKGESPETLQTWLDSVHKSMETPLSSGVAGVVINHATLVALREEAAKHNLYVGTDGKLHPKQEAAAAAKPEAPKTGPQAGGAVPPAKPKGTKLTQEHAREIRGLRLQGWTHGQLVEHYGSSKGVINNILTYKSHREGPVTRGEKATLHHAREIRYRAEKEHLTQKQLAAEYGITDKQVWHILHGTTLKEPGAAAPPSKPKGGTAPKTEQAAGTEVKPDLKAYLDRVAKVVEAHRPGKAGETKAAKVTTGAGADDLFYQHNQQVAKALGIESHEVKNYILHETAKRTNGMLDANQVRQYQSEWNHWPDGVLSRSAMLAVKEKFNLPDDAMKGVPIHDLSPEHRAQARAFVDAHHEVIQEVFGKAGITHIHLTRGLSFDHGDVPEAMKGLVKNQQVMMTYMERPLASFTRRDSTARQFATGYRPVGFLVGMEIPISRLFGLGWDTMGTTSEAEYVLLGGPSNAAVKRVKG